MCGVLVPQSDEVDPLFCKFLLAVPKYWDSYRLTVCKPQATSSDTSSLRCTRVPVCRSVGQSLFCH